MAHMVRSLRRRTSVFNLKNLPERYIPGCKEHLEIVAALEHRDPDQARQKLVTHLEAIEQCTSRSSVLFRF
jgi:DNA-binding GntR family transcriptional regulator